MTASQRETPATPGPAELDGTPTRRTVFGIALGLALFTVILLLPVPAGMSVAGWRTTAVAALMATWWMFEAIPVAATALLPIALFPLVGAGPLRAVTAPYANPIIFLFLGGFVLAIAIERWALHRRMALSILSMVGSRSERIVGGFLVGTALLSMWLSNTATSVMMLPIALSVLGLLEESSGSESGEGRSDLPVAMLLALAYGASIGGIATLVGTPPNGMLAAYLSETYGHTLGFAQWMTVGVPLMLLMLGAAWLVLTRLSFRVGGEVPGAAELIKAQKNALGRWSRGEKLVAAVFGVTALSWICRPTLVSAFAGTSLSNLSDAGIAMTAAIVVFLVPVDSSGGKTRFLMTWKAAERVPWGVLLLFGGGLSVADRINQNGVASWIGSRLELLGAWPIVLLLLLVITTIVFLTELTSNAATTATFLPVLAAIAVSVGQSPLLFAVPAAMGASCAFMMPVATPPNAIVYGSGKITIPQMARAGLWLNLFAIVVILTIGYYALSWAFGVQLGVVPDWAGTASP